MAYSHNIVLSIFTGTFCICTVPQPAAAAKPFYPLVMEQPIPGMMASSVCPEDVAIQHRPDPSLRHPSTAATAISLGDKSPGLIAIFDRYV